MQQDQPQNEAVHIPIDLGVLSEFIVASSQLTTLAASIMMNKQVSSEQVSIYINLTAHAAAALSLLVVRSNLINAIPEYADRIDQLQEMLDTKHTAAKTPN